MANTTSIVGIPTAGALSVSIKRYVTAGLIRRAPVSKKEGGIETRTQEIVVNPDNEKQTVITLLHRFDTRANGGVGRTDCEIHVNTWRTVTDTDGNHVVAPSRVTFKQVLSFEGRSLGNSSEMLELVLGAQGLMYTLNGAVPETGQIQWLAAGSLDFYTE